MKTKALFLILIQVLFLSVPSLFASDCGKKFDCPSGIKYPYKFCKFDTVAKKVTMETICTDDPLKYQENNPNFVPQKVKLPIYVMVPPVYLYLVSYFSIYKDGKFEVVLFGETYQRMASSARNDLVAAGNKWNCVCGDTIDPNNPTNIGTIIKSEFSDNPRDFFEPYRNPAVAKTSSATQDDYPCGLNLDSSRILFNITPQFLYNRDSLSHIAPGTPLEKGWFSQEFRGNVGLVPNYVRLYSFQQVAMHEIGHLLGFGHYNDDFGSYVGQVCDNAGLTLDGTMEYDIAPRDNNLELSLHDKCMMAKLYCDSLVILNIYEYQPQTQKVYPNPGKYVVNFEFELPRHTENLRMYINDVLGQTVLTVLENTVKESGEHKILINVDNLAVGTYYIIIEAGSYRTAQPVMIVR